MIDLSVVITIRNEAPGLEELHRELTETLGAWGRSYELIVVDDGSTDDGFRILTRLQEGDAHLRVIRFRRNFGKTAALSAAFAAVRGRMIATLDGDLQMDPLDIPRLVQRLEDEDLDLVCGWRQQRKDALVSRRLPSMVANGLISWTTGVRLHDYGCSLKVFRAEVIKSLRLYGGTHRFIPALATEQGVAMAEVVVNHRPRKHGRSNYGISRTIFVVLDLLTVKFLLSFATRPLQIFGLLGLAMVFPGVLVMAYLTFLKFVMMQSIANRPLLWLGFLLVLTGVQFLTLGLLAEIQARIYYESQGKPTYVIREIRESPASNQVTPVSRAVCNPLPPP
jgi:glycosyltransferase involved in cell wall biosynthesis